MTIQVSRPEASLHLLLCIVALILGILWWANVLHVGSLHVAVGIIVTVIAILSAL